MKKPEREAVVEALLSAAKLIASEDFEMPLKGGLAKSDGLLDLFDTAISKALEEDENRDPDEEDYPDEEDFPTSVPPAVLRSARSFDQELWKQLLHYLPEYVYRYSEDNETTEEMYYRIASNIWNKGFSYRFFLLVIGRSSLKPEFFGLSPEELRQLVRQIEVESYSHALENALYAAALDYIEKPNEEGKPALRGPDHDDVVYKFDGTNDSIAGASGRGLYVAKLSSGQLRDESRETGHCIGNKKHGHPQLLMDGTTELYSIRTPNGGTKFTIERFVEDGNHPTDGHVQAGTVTEVKGTANRLPGFEPDSSEMTKPDDVRLVVDFLVNYLKMSPDEVSRTKDIRAGVAAMKAMGVDPFSPPPKRAPRPHRDPRVRASMKAVSAAWALVDYSS